MKLFNKSDKPVDDIGMGVLQNHEQTIKERFKVTAIENPKTGKTQKIFESKALWDKAGDSDSENPDKIYESVKVQLESIDPEYITAHYGWLKQGDDFHIIPKVNVPALPSGYYSIRENYEGYYLQKKYVFLDELFLLPDTTIKDVVADIQTFWQRKDKYKEYNITYKRGIMLHGAPGTGKSSVINFLIHILVTEFNGLVFDYAYGCEEMIRQVRLMQPEKPIMVIMEDIDGILASGSTSKILNLLDGNSQIDNIVYLATTNYLDRLEPRIKNRPSRFDRKFEIGFPDESVRKFFIEQKLKEQDLSNIDIATWVRDTDGMTLSHLKELIVSVVVMDKPYQDVIAVLKEMNEA